MRWIGEARSKKQELQLNVPSSGTQDGHAWKSEYRMLLRKPFLAQPEDCSRHSAQRGQRLPPCTEELCPQTCRRGCAGRVGGGTVRFSA